MLVCGKKKFDFSIKMGLDIFVTREVTWSSALMSFYNTFRFQKKKNRTAS